jgi:hypothetical protein
LGFRRELKLNGGVVGGVLVVVTVTTEVVVAVEVVVTSEVAVVVTSEVVVETTVDVEGGGEGFMVA